METLKTQKEQQTQSKKNNTGFFKPVVQKKLSVGSANDSYEVEADQVADKVMKMREPSPQVTHTGALVQRKCAHCEQEEQLQMKPLAESISPFIQRSSSESGGIAPDHVENQINSSRDGGNSMDHGTQSFMESRFGTDFSDVKIHTGSEAVQMSRELGAQAFAVGNDIYFNEGKYNPNSDSGKHLLAHELTHTVQQSGRSKTLQNTSIPNSVQRTTHHSDSGGGPGHPLPRRNPCTLAITGPQEVNKYCAAYVPSDAASCGTFPAPNITLTATGIAAGTTLTWSISQGATKASIVGAVNGTTAVIKGEAPSATTRDVTVSVSNGTCTATRTITVRKPSSMTSAQSPTTSATVISNQITYTVKDQFNSAMGAGICVDETITVCHNSLAGANFTFGDAATDANGQVRDNLSGTFPRGVPANLCVKLNQTITAGGCGPLLRNTITYRSTGITLLPGTSCTAGGSCP